MGAEVFAFSNIQTITDTVAPILSSILITLRQRKNAIIILALSFVLKFVSFFPLVAISGYKGMIFSSVLCSLLVIIMSFILLRRNYAFSLKTSAKRLLMIALASALALLPSALINSLWPLNYESRFICLFFLALHAIASAGLYLLISYIFYLPQSIFHLKGKDILKLFSRFKG